MLHLIRPGQSAQPSATRPVSSPRFGTAQPQAAAIPQAAPADTFQPTAALVRFSGPRTPLITNEDAVNRLLKISETRTISFRQKFQAVLDEAKADIEEYLKTHPAEKAAIGMDLDETILDNTGYESLRLGTSLTYYDWTRKAEAPAIPEALEFFNWVREKGVKVFFISARQEFLRGATVDNLNKVGITPDQYAGLYLKSKGFPKSKSAAVFKSEAREDIQKQGLDFIAMLGDQKSDIEGTLGKGYLLPNSLYTVH